MFEVISQTWHSISLSYTSYYLGSLKKIISSDFEIIEKYFKLFLETLDFGVLIKSRLVESPSVQALLVLNYGKCGDL